MHSPAAAAAFRSVAVKEQAGPKVRERSPSFSDHFSQATQFWNSMSDWEKDHIAAAFAFELNQVVDEVVRDRTMNEILVNIHKDLAAMVSEATGIAVSPAGTPEAPTPSAPTPAGPLRKDADKLRSPALSMDKPAPTIKGRKVAVLVGDGVDTGEVEAMLEALSAAELVPETIGPRAGTVAASDGPMKVNRAAPNAPSVVYDAVLVPTGVGPALAAQTLAQRFVHEAWRHGKPIAVAPDAEALLEAAGVPASDDGVTVADAAALTARLVRPRPAPLSTPRLGAAAVLATPLDAKCSEPRRRGRIAREGQNGGYTGQVPTDRRRGACGISGCFRVVRDDVHAHCRLSGDRRGLAAVRRGSGPRAARLQCAVFRRGVRHRRRDRLPADGRLSAPTPAVRAAAGRRLPLFRPR